MCKRGDIYFVDFGNNHNSHKQSGLRPAIIVSNNKANANAPVITVVPLSARVWKRRYLPTHVFIPLKKTDWINRAWHLPSRWKPWISVVLGKK